MSYRFRTTIPKFIRQQRQQQQQRFFWNYSPWKSTSSVVAIGTRTVWYKWTDVTKTVAILLSSVTTFTVINIYLRHAATEDEIARETIESSSRPVDHTVSNGNPSSGINVLATSPWMKSPQMEQQPNNISKELPPQNLHAPNGSWRIIRPNPYIQICFDTRTRNPIYVQYKLLVHPQPKGPLVSSGNSNSSKNNINSNNAMKRRPNYHFYEDTSMEERYRSRNSYYHNSGYDRGHLAPAADFSHSPDDENDNHIDAMLKSTYNLCNISPQHAELNRIVWNQLEQLIRQMASRYYHELDEAVTYVTTGPIYLPSLQINDKTFQYTIMGIGKPPSLILVPTHFFKVVVVLDKTETNILHFACFVLPNDPNITESSKTKSFERFIVPWTDLEAVTGLSFYPDLVDESWKVYADHITRAIPQSPPPTTKASTIEGRHQQLVLTDGNQSNSPKTVISKQQQSLYKELQHLCANQACAPRKQQ